MSLRGAYLVEAPNPRGGNPVLYLQLANGQQFDIANLPEGVELQDGVITFTQNVVQNVETQTILVAQTLPETQRISLTVELNEEVTRTDGNPWDFDKLRDWAGDRYEDLGRVVNGFVEGVQQIGDDIVRKLDREFSLGIYKTELGQEMGVVFGLGLAGVSIGALFDGILNNRGVGRMLVRRPLNLLPGRFLPARLQFLKTTEGVQADAEKEQKRRAINNKLNEIQQVRARRALSGQDKRDYNRMTGQGYQNGLNQLQQTELVNLVAELQAHQATNQNVNPMPPFPSQLDLDRLNAVRNRFNDLKKT